MEPRPARGLNTSEARDVLLGLLKALVVPFIVIFVVSAMFAFFVWKEAGRKAYAVREFASD